jgi:transporter family-2 protein
MWTYWLLILLALVAGFCLPTQAGVNARLNLLTHSTVLTATISFAVGTIVLAAYAMFLKTPLPAVESLTRSPWWIWVGGIIGAFFVASTIILAPRLGAGAMVAGVVAGQMLASMVLDHFGLIGYPIHPISGLRILGVLMLMGGVVLIRLY